MHAHICSHSRDPRTTLRAPSGAWEGHSPKKVHGRSLFSVPQFKPLKAKRDLQQRPVEAQLPRPFPGGQGTPAPLPRSLSRPGLALERVTAIPLMGQM